MQLKTYIDHDLASALGQARDELGAEALVLNQREISDERGRPRIQITVGVDRPRADVADTRAALRRLAQSVARRSTGGKRHRAETTEPDTADQAAPAPGAPEKAAAEAPARPARPTKRPTSSRHAAVEIAVASLVQSGLSRDLAQRFAAIASHNLKGDGNGRMALAAERGVAALLPFGPMPTSARVLFVVGPPGAGKTSTLAKLSARAVEDSRRPVVYAMADNEKIGALAESEIYARHVGAQLQVIDTPQDLRETLDRNERHARVLIDTAGIGATDTTRMAALSELREQAPNAQVALVLPAGLHRHEARRVFRQFAPVRPTSVAFSKVDDGRRIGDLVTALAETDLPLSFMTNGHRVPDDLVAATPRRLAALMLRAGMPTSISQESIR